MFKPIVLITSATSRHGRQAANLLLAQGKYIIRLAARDPSQLAGLPAEAIAVDPNSVDSMTRACTGVDFVYLILPSLVRHDAEVAMFHTFLQAALATNIRHVVYLSALDAVPASNAALLQPIIHHRFEHEQALRSSGIPFTCLRAAAWVQENQVTVHGEAIERTVCGLGSSAGDGDGAWTSATIADVTKVAAVVMEDPLLHRGRIYTVTTEPVMEDAGEPLIPELHGAREPSIPELEISSETTTMEETEEVPGWRLNWNAIVNDLVTAMKVLFIMGMVVIVIVAFMSCVSRDIHEPAELKAQYSKAGRKLSAGLPLYKDANQPVNVRVADLLGRMTVDEKIGQMTQIERSVSDDATLRSYEIGSVLSGGGSAPAPNATVAQWVAMTDSFQMSALSTRLGIPEIYGIDAMHGHNNVYGATIFPHSVGLGCTREPALLERIGTATALEVRATGIPYVFEPSVAVCRDPRWGNCYQSYSEDPEVVRSMTAIIDGLQGIAPAGWDGPYVQNGRKVAACATAFVGDGGTVEGIDANNTVMDLDSLKNIHMKGYVEAIKKGVSTIMVAFSCWNGVKMHANKFLLTDILKGQMGFKGFVISNWFGVDRIEDGRGFLNPQGPNYANSVELALNAGIDMVMVPYNYTTFISDVKTLVAEQKVPMSRIDDAVTRILRVKFQMGLFEAPFADKSLVSFLGAPAHRALAREAVRKSLVLLKNGKAVGQPLLPLRKDAAKVLVVGTHANDIGLQCGGWTITWQGQPGNNVTTGTTILEGIKQAVSPTTQVVFDAAPKLGSAKGMGYNYAIVVVGEQPYAEFMGDNLNSLALETSQQQMINDICADVACVVVMVSGRPLVAEPWVATVDAFVAAWLPGSEGNGVADVLFGDFEFQGTLARTWFRSVDQLPLNVGDARYDPLYPFGFGMKMGARQTNGMV